MIDRWQVGDRSGCDPERHHPFSSTSSMHGGRHSIQVQSDQSSRVCRGRKERRKVHERPIGVSLRAKNHSIGGPSLGYRDLAFRFPSSF